MYKTDTLTMSRLNRLLLKYGLDGLPFDSDNAELTTIIMDQLDENLLFDICEIIGYLVDDKNIAIKHVSEFMQQVNYEVNLYLQEIENRQQYVQNIKEMWQPDDDKVDDEQFYKNDYYLICFKTLSEHHVNPCSLNLYESLILSEEFACADIAKGISEMIAVFDDKYKTIAADFRDKLKHANFMAFMMDIYDAVEEIYKSYQASGGK